MNSGSRHFVQFSRRNVLVGAIGLAACSAVSANGPSGHDGMAQTVLGPLDASRLGFTLPHEHVAQGADVLARWPSAWGGRAELVARTVDKLKLVRAGGVSTIVDLTPYDVGRDAPFLAEVSRASGITMIACTGQRFFPPASDVEMPSRTIDGLSDFFRREIEEGIDETGIRAGVIKIGVATQDLTDLEEVGLRAGARASKATGAPVRVHADAANRAGESIAAILEDERVDPARVSFDHSDDSGDMDYFLGLAGRGYSLGMDHVHRGLMPDFTLSFERRAECIKLLVDAGFADKVFLSADTQLGGWMLPEDVQTFREKSPWDPPEGLLFVSDRLIPHLKRIGVSDRSIGAMTMDNPRRFFSLS